MRSSVSHGRSRWRTALARWPPRRRRVVSRTFPRGQRPFGAGRQRRPGPPIDAGRSSARAPEERQRPAWPLARSQQRGTVQCTPGYLPLGRLPVTRHTFCPSGRPAAAAVRQPAGLASRWRGGGWAPGGAGRRGRGAGRRRQVCACEKGLCISYTLPLARSLSGLAFLCHWMRHPAIDVFQIAIEIAAGR